MARDPRDESLRKHKEWLGYLQPVGLVVSPPAMADADCHVNVDVATEYQQFVESTTKQLLPGRDEPVSVVNDLKKLLIDVFGWKETDLVPAGDPRAANLNVYLEGYDDHLQPSFAVIDDPKADPAKWLMLIQEINPGLDFDFIAEGDNRKWQATPQARFERLLRETQIPTGLLSNGVEFRIVYAPRGESPGHITYPVPIMLETAGRTVFAALLMLLRESRIFGSTGGKTLNDVLSASRKYQNTVSTELAEQVLAALYELLRGFQAADAHRKSALLADVLAREPDQVYAGQLTVLLRLVFLLYAEDRGLMSESEIYIRHYSVTGLYDKLREDAGRHPDTMDQRYGAWARLITLFRMVHDGAQGGGIHLPPRRGYLFDPDRYPFLEGRAFQSERKPGERITAPVVSDGVVYRVLRNLMILDGERLSYRALDVEQIGSVYEAMMGFRIEKATGRSIAIKPKKPHGAPVTINLEALLAETGDKRGKLFQEKADLKLTPKESAALKTAKTPEDVVALLDRKVAKAVTPNIVPSGSMVLQPSDERRRSGSHYTPRSLTEPIVRKALEPILGQLGDNPKPRQILDLKVCDPAMGSGAFLVETCRQLGELLVKSWHAHSCLPKIPPDEDELLHAQRLIAQRCLYGVDKNPMAVDLAKLSLWLVTLAKEHPFTFVDHTLRCGDSLVGLTLQQIKDFHWLSIKNETMPIGQDVILDRIKSATAYRQKILDAGDVILPGMMESQLKSADDALNLVRFAGNLVVAAYFAAEKDKARLEKRDEYLSLLSEYLRTSNMALRPTKQEAALITGDKPLLPFHWEIEYPEVFGKKGGGFDCIVGNPPFMGGMLISTSNTDNYRDWLYAAYANSGNRMDLVAYFFRRAFEIANSFGTIGLIATNTIFQGDTRSGGLGYICLNGGTIYSAIRRLRWPGQAAVVVSVVHLSKHKIEPPYDLDNISVNIITSYLFHAGGSEEPKSLMMNRKKCSIGNNVLGMGFTFDDKDTKGVATSISTMNEIVLKNPKNLERIFPFIGGEEINDSPLHSHHRYIINFGEMKEEQAKKWPDLYNIVEMKVKPERIKKEGTYSKQWWLFGRRNQDGQKSIQNLARVLVCSLLQPHWCITFFQSEVVFSHALGIFAYSTSAAFCLLQSRLHEIWARFFGSSMKDDLRYTPSDCFETFPFPPGFEQNSALEAVGQEYYEFRAALMVKHNEGLTKTYNRFHDPHERNPDILKLRELHDQMDRAVLHAYGPPFSELPVPKCEFLLDYEEDEDEEETAGKRQKKKPWRYRWPDEFRDNVLALLLELNKQRAEGEETPDMNEGKTKAKKTVARKPKKTNKDQPELFG